MNNLFIQFYSKTEEGYFDLQNGFSDTFDYCDNLGDVIWLQNDQRVETFANDKIPKLPTEDGNVYVSACYLSHLYTVYVWAEDNPNINFILGGPAVASRVFSIEENNIPKNIRFIESSVEEYFNIENFSHPWKINIPDSILKGDNISLNYTINNQCYWAKCVFCAYSKNTHKRQRDQFRYEFTELDYDDIVVRIGTEALDSELIVDVGSTLPISNNITYRTFMRPGKQEYDVLRKLNNFNINITTLGIEYPSVKMWKYMKKGHHLTYVMGVINELTRLNRSVVLSLILGWPNLEMSDLLELETFLKLLPDNLIECKLNLYRLYMINNTEYIDQEIKGEEIKIGPFTYGYYTKLNSKQLSYNKLSKQMILSYSKMKNITVRDMCKI